MRAPPYIHHRHSLQSPNTVRHLHVPNKSQRCNPLNQPHHHSSPPVTAQSSCLNNPQYQEHSYIFCCPYFICDCLVYGLCAGSWCWVWRLGVRYMRQWAGVGLRTLCVSRLVGWWAWVELGRWNEDYRPRWAILEIWTKERKHIHQSRIRTLIRGETMFG
jgi:hypothetical protein